MTSYLTLIETASIWYRFLARPICQMLPIITYSTCILCRRWGWPSSNFVEIFGSSKFESASYHMALFAWS